MKQQIKRVSLLAVILVFALILPSCLKDDVQDLKADFKKTRKNKEALQQEIDSLNNVLASIKNLIGSDEPMLANWSTTNSDGNSESITKEYSFKSIGYNTQYLTKQPDGTYYVYVERFEDVSWNSYASFSFVYDPATHQAEGYSMRVYDRDSFGNGMYVQVSPESYTGNTINITVNSFDLATGDLDVRLVGTTTVDSENNRYSGEGMNFEFEWKGKMEEFEYNNN